jgi:hypothetical protein
MEKCDAVSLHKRARRPGEGMARKTGTWQSNDA